MKTWLTKAMDLLKASLEPPRHELNELDWKAALSPNKQRLTEHLSAFANYMGGGFLVVGIGQKGEPIGVNEIQVAETTNQLTNLGRNALEPPLMLDHAVESYLGVRLLFVHIPESPVKTVHLRGKGLEHAFIRTGGSTRPASRQEIGGLLLHSRTPRWEESRASTLLTGKECTSLLNVEPILRMLKRPIPSDTEGLLAWMTAERFLIRESTDGFFITNLGAIAAAQRLSSFPDLRRKAVRVIIYDGVNKVHTKHEQERVRGYAITFRKLIKYVMSVLPQTETIKDALRQRSAVYPDIALREIVANALIHQDFSLVGTGPLIEIFDNRIEISNPGTLLPSKRLDQLIGTQPESRNEQLAGAFRRYNICEERGSGLVKAGLAVELYGLPPIHFTASPHHFKVTLFGARSFAKMSHQERLDACYQHTVLKYVSDSHMTNKSLRERLRMPDKQRSMVSALIQEALDLGLIKPADPENKSRKFAEYIPFWA